ncbi:hypothetical protein DITRI_Ditri06bG0062100 [Diplodiscus trichospermus]
MVSCNLETKEFHSFNNFLPSLRLQPCQDKPPKYVSLFIVLSVFENYSVSAKPSDQSYASAASESENKSVSSVSLPVLPEPDSPTTEAEAVAETLSPTYFSVPPSVNIPDVETRSSETFSPENVPNLSNADEPTGLQITRSEENLSQELVSPPSVNIDPTLENKGDENMISTSLSHSIVDNSVLDSRDMDNLSEENTSLPPSPSVDVHAVGSKEDENNNSPALAPVYIDTPALETSDDGSFTRKFFFLLSMLMLQLQNPKILKTCLNLMTTAHYQKQQFLHNLRHSFSQNQTPTIQMAPSNDDTFCVAPTSHKILPFNYRAENEPVEPYQDEEVSWNGVNVAVAGVLVGAYVIRVGGFAYHNRKKDNIRAQYQCLTKKGGLNLSYTTTSIIPIL